MGLKEKGTAAFQTVFQSTHPVWDGTQEQRAAGMAAQISIHPSRVGWDRKLHPREPERIISIHPSRVGWDCGKTPRSSRRPDFNPPIPCGMGLSDPASVLTNAVFQSTHPVWDGTLPSDTTKTDTAISIHPSRVGWDAASSTGYESAA